MFDLIAGSWFWLAVAASLCWGVNVILLRYSTSPVKEQLFFVGLGVFCAFLFLPFFYPLAPMQDLGLGFLAGFIWVIGCLLSLFSLKSLGIGRVAGLWGGFSILASATTLFFLNESLVWFNYFAGVVLLLLMCLLIYYSKPPAFNFKGFLLAALTGILWGFWSLPFKFTSSNAFGFLPATGLAVFLASLVYARGVGFSSFKKNLVNFISGISWSFATYLFLLSLSQAGFLVPVLVSRLYLVIQVIAGIFLFKETTSLKESLLLGLATVVAIAGIFFLANSVY